MSAALINQETCKICHAELGDDADVVEVHQKGADGINSASVQRGDDIVISAGEKVPSKCRMQYINKKAIKRQHKKRLNHQREVPQYYAVDM